MGSRAEGGARLQGNDILRAELQAQFPSWRFWYIHRAVGGYTWCAQRLPLLETDTAGALVEAIVAAEGSGPAPLVDTVTLGVPTNGPDRLTVLDRIRTELRSTFPNWYPHYTPYADGRVTWHAQQVPVLNADRPEELARDILSTQGSRVVTPSEDPATITELHSGSNHGSPS